jgi:hypothetical protein
VATDLRAASRAAREKANSLTNVDLTANELKQLDQVDLQTQQLEEELQKVEASESAGQAAQPSTTGAAPPEKPPAPAGQPAQHAPPHPSEPAKPAPGKTGSGAGGAAKIPAGQGVEEAAFKSVSQLEHEGVAAKITTADGHEIRVAKDGTAWMCTDPCELFLHRYQNVVKTKEALADELKEIEQIADPEKKAEALKKLRPKEELAKEWNDIQQITDPKKKAETLKKLRPKVEAAHQAELQYLPMESTYRHGARQGNVLRLEPEDWTHIRKRHVKTTFDPLERADAPVTSLFKGSPEEYLDILYEAVKKKHVVRKLAKGKK